MVEMFSRLETQRFGIVFFACIVTALIMSVAFELYLRKRENRIDKVKFVPRNEFNELGEWALHYQKMISFIAETNLDEITMVVIDVDSDKKDA